MDWIKHGIVVLIIASTLLGSAKALEGAETPHAFRLVGVFALLTCTLTAAAIVRAVRWTRLPLSGAFALSALVAWDALLGDRANDEVMSSPLLGYLLLNTLVIILAVAALGMAALGRKPKSS